MDEKKEAQEQEVPPKGKTPQEAAQDQKKEAPGVPEVPSEEKGLSPLEEARSLDKSIRKGNDELKALLEKQEKLLAEARIEGRSFAGQSQAPAFSKEEQESRNRIKEVGLATGANWAKNMEKEDATKN